MELRSISAYFDDTYIDCLRSDGTWQVNKVKGQIKLADDFISIFNRPTRRRMLVISPEGYKNLGTSVIRVRDADEIFLIGNPQKDLGNGGAYRVTLPMNKVSGQVEIFRKCIEGTEANPGPLVRRSIGKYYMDLELRTLTNEGETINAAISKYFFWFPNDIKLLRDDEFEFEGEEFRVLETFHDTGFRGVRATTEKDSREELVYKHLSGKVLYDNNTGQYSKPYINYTISAEVSEKIESRKEMDELYESTVYTVLIQGNHISVTPSTKDSIIIDDNDRQIESIRRDRHSRVWELMCR